MTSIEWLEQKAKEFSIDLDLLNYFEQAKEMHKQEIIDAYERGDKYKTEIPGEQYYQETFVSKGSDDHISDVSKMVDVPQQETLYTEEQVRRILNKGMGYAYVSGIDGMTSKEAREDFNKYVNEIIQSLKQPKKD